MRGILCVGRLCCLLFITLVVTFSMRAQETASFRKDELVRTEVASARNLERLSSALSAGQEGYDALYYRLDLTLILNPKGLRGSVRMDGRALVNNLTTISLDLMSTMKVDSAVVAGLKVTETQQPTLVIISLDRPYQMGERFSVTVYYGGVPGSSGFGSFTFSSTSTGSPWIWTLSEPYGAKDWWQCKDHPSDKADSVDIWVTCDSRFKVGSQGRLVEVIDRGNGTKTHRWEHRYPIATYLVSIAVAEYVEGIGYFKYSSTDSMPVINYTLASRAAEAAGSMAATISMLNIFSDLYGLYPFVKEKYGHAQFGWGGGMEHQTMTSLVNFSENLVAHEMAHQWFGDMITMSSWPHIWLNEGFATYSVALYHERKSGAAGYRNIMNGEMASARGAVGSIYVSDTSSVSKLFKGNLVYSKGATVLHMLRHVMGDSLFFRALRNYATDHRFRFGTATTEDFRAVCETVLRGKSLNSFFQQWIYGENFPKYTYEWGSEQVGTAYRVRVSIRQSTGTSNPSFFTMPVDLKFIGAGMDTTITVMSEQASQSFVIVLPQRPTNVKLDPENWILKDASGTVVSVEEVGSLPHMFALHQNYPNPFNPSTTVVFDLPSRLAIRLSVYDQLGRLVKTLAQDQSFEAGRHSVVFNATDESGMELPSGIYYTRLFAPGYSVQSSRMVYVR